MFSFSGLTLGDEIVLARLFILGQVKVRLPSYVCGASPRVQEAQSSPAEMRRYSGKETSQNVYILMIVGFPVQFPAD